MVIINCTVFILLKKKGRASHKIATLKSVTDFVVLIEVLQEGFVERPYDADLVFCSWVLNVRMNKLEKTEDDLFRKCL